MAAKKNKAKEFFKTVKGAKGKKASKKTAKKKGFPKTKEENLKESTLLSSMIEAIMTQDHAKAHNCLKDAVNFKVAQRISQEINTPLF